MKVLTAVEQTQIRDLARHPDFRPKVVEQKELLCTAMAKVEAQRTWLTESLKSVDDDLAACRDNLAFFDEVLSELSA